MKQEIKINNKTYEISIEEKESRLRKERKEETYQKLLKQSLCNDIKRDYFTWDCLFDFFHDWYYYPKCYENYDKDVEILYEVINIKDEYKRSQRAYDYLREYLNLIPFSDERGYVIDMKKNLIHISKSKRKHSLKVKNTKQDHVIETEVVKMLIKMYYGRQY